MEETVHDVKAALELPAGGYTFDEEIPLFGRPELDVLPINPQLPSELTPATNTASEVLVGAWWDMEKGHGVMLGKWADSRGQVVGHVKGIYGRSHRLKSWVFFGKLVNVHGYAKALLSGRFSHGVFQGVLQDQEGRTLGHLHGLSNRSSLVQGNLVGRLDLLSEPGQPVAFAVGR
jgi:hypothetical protein